MIVFKTFMRLLRRTFYVGLSYILIFMVISILTVPKPEKGNKPQDYSWSGAVNYCLTDEDQSPASKAFAAYLADNFTEVSFNGTPQQKDDAILTGAISASITIKKDFESRIAHNEKAVSFMLDPRGTNGAWIESAIGQYLRMAYLQIGPDGHIDQQALNRILSVHSSLITPQKTQQNYDQLRDNWYQRYFMYMSYIMMVVTLLLFGNLMLPFKSGNVPTRSLVSGYPNHRFQLELIGGLAVMMAVVLVIFLSGAVIIGGKPSAVPNLGLLVLNMGVFALVSLTASYLLITILPNPGATSAIANVVPLGLSFISGVIVPQNLISSVPAAISKAFPMFYYVRVCEGSPSPTFDLGIQLLFAAVYLLLALVVNRARKKESLGYDPVPRR